MWPTVMARSNVIRADTLEIGIRQAFPTERGTLPDPQARLNCLRELHRYYLQFFTSPEESPALGDWVAPEQISQIEAEWNRYEEARVQEAKSGLPVTAEEFQDWFAVVAAENEYQDVCNYLRHDASLLDIALLVLAEAKVDSRFDDLMALAQIGSSDVTKMTIARNYWDEMGNGDYDTVHTTMFNKTAGWMQDYAAGLDIDLGILEFAEAYANAAELLMYNLRRRYLLRGLAGIGLLEQTAPARFAATVDGLRRLGVPEHVSRYQATHVVVDQDHSREWVDGVFMPIIKKNPDAITEFAIGVLIRGNVASEFFHKVHHDLFGLG
jgi:hypothetical protein